MNIPLYVQVKQRITDELVSGKWRAGDMIPSEIELANDFKVSQGTVRKAIDALSNEKILVRRQGKGTYVTTHDEEQIQLRFLRLTSTKGHKEKLESELFSFKKIRSSSYVAKQLNLIPGSPVFQIKRLLTFDRLYFQHWTCVDKTCLFKIMKQTSKTGQLTRNGAACYSDIHEINHPGSYIMIPNSRPFPFAIRADQKINELFNIRSVSIKSMR